MTYIKGSNCIIEEYLTTSHLLATAYLGLRDGKENTSLCDINNLKEIKDDITKKMIRLADLELQKHPMFEHRVEREHELNKLNVIGNLVTTTAYLVLNATALYFELYRHLMEALGVTISAASGVAGDLSICLVLTLIVFKITGRIVKDMKAPLRCIGLAVYRRNIYIYIKK